MIAVSILTPCNNSHFFKYIYIVAAPEGELPDTSYRQGEETLPQSDEGR